MRPNKSSFLDSGYAGVSPHVRESNSLGFWTPRPGFRILHAKFFGFHVQVKIFRILESGFPYIGQGVVADIHRRGTDLEVYLLVSFRDICLYCDAARSRAQ